MGAKVSRVRGVCAICQEPDKGEMARPSSCPTHFFHRRCLIQWAARKSLCPLDNKPFVEVISTSGARTMVQRFRSYTEDGRSDAAQLLRMANPISKGIVCRACRRADETQELAVVKDCSHVCHRRCAVKFGRKFHRCPTDGCYNRQPTVGTELDGDIVIAKKDLARCSLCAEGETGKEWARPDGCHHYFHRVCLTPAVRAEAKCPAEGCGAPVRFVMCDYGDKVAIREDELHFRCPICEEVDGEKEAALQVPCCHLVHVRCLFFRPRLSLYCRQPGCCERIEHILTEMGSVLYPSYDDSAGAYAKTMAGTQFRCFLCHKEDNESERAKPASCGCEFHRTCLLRAAKESVGRPQCPLCRHEYSRIQCLFGDDIVLKETKPERRQSLYRSVPDLSRNSRGNELTTDMATMARASSHNNLI